MEKLIRKVRRFLFLLLFSYCSPIFSQSNEAYDIVIYGGTSAGISAAIQSSRMGKSVVLIEPSSRIGGLTTGGLGKTDIGNKAAIGGISREFYVSIAKFYTDPDNWKWQKRDEYKEVGQTDSGEKEAAMWMFEPSAAMKIYDKMIEDNHVTVISNERLNRETGVSKLKNRIRTITMESGQSFSGKMFIDATYEGDLMAAAGVSYTTGREANSQYGETLNGNEPDEVKLNMTGIESRNAINHNFVDGVDPYSVKGKPESGLLPCIQTGGPGVEGAGDTAIQAYCFRMCLTDHPDNRIPFEKPVGYNEQNYELLLRNYEAGESKIPWINSSMPNRKTDTNNSRGFSTDFIGQNYAYPEAGYAEREKIAGLHREYQKGLMWTLANHPRIPDQVRKEVARWGTCKDEFTEGMGWQEQLYVREARRMVSSYVMTQRNCEGLEIATDPVGLAAYGMDSHNVRRYVNAKGFVKNEGNVESRVMAPYPVSYRSIVPREEECSNLLVPVCISSTHIAFGSIRMEPVFMVLGQSAATAASLAIDKKTAVQQLKYKVLRERLIHDGQRLEWERNIY
jgi:hypothetical protein